MKIAAVGVISSNIKKTVEFYTLLGFTFGPIEPADQHIEPIECPAGARLMIDSKELITDILGNEPKPSNHSAFAIEYDHPEEVDKTVQELTDAHYTIIKTPWDAFWGQRYAIVSDPDGYLVDLYAPLAQ